MKLRFDGAARLPEITGEVKNTPPPSEPDPLVREKLLEFRSALLKLHKALIESERVGYEQTFGSIRSQGNFLQLLIQDPWFAWLRPLSELIVLIDETLDGEQPMTPESAESFGKSARSLLTPAESETGFASHYFEALQRDPDVVMAHAEMLKTLGRK